ncbi:uncharacterized protein A4U43_UnF12060 [Asparagus officinalis]|uniref:Uncharacterized protein n=1 Tax=Asparagus officinalis TaxID=4686 RepID=A0A1R3L555_ASPOF|nr:uncharacterized protein A4U43_UnF12060 [Asparagus officinalis]
MLRIAAASGAAISIKRAMISAAPLTLLHKTNLLNNQLPPISRPSLLSSRCYARMARRSPPAVRPNAYVSEESESEEEENELEFDDDEDDEDEEDDGEDSEEWEGFEMDFGSVGKKENVSNKEEKP